MMHLKGEINKIGLTINSNDYKNLIIDISKRYISEKDIPIENIDTGFIKTIQKCIEESIAKKEPEQELLILLSQIKDLEISNKYTQYKYDFTNTPR